MAGVETILPAAQAILPSVVYKIFMIGGPIMAIITTLNGVFNDVRYPIAQAAKDGWLPKGILKENRLCTISDLYIHIDRSTASDHF